MGSGSSSSASRWVGLLAAGCLLAATILADTASAADVSPPNGTVTVPTRNQVLQGDGPFALSGTATDDVGVSRVDVAIKDRTTNRWLQPNGTWSPTFAWLSGALASPGAPTTGWGFSFAGEPGQYTIGARARDTSGKLDPSVPWVQFGVVAPTPPPTSDPNIVLILTDDQRWDTLWSMPNVQSLLVNHGVTFTNGFAVDPLCCPSRAAILKGAYAHSTRVYHNEGTNGPFGSFDDSSTVATWLRAGGYRTALIGKYFNGYTPSRASYVPPGWDRWVAFATNDVGGGAYYNYGLSVDGTLVNRGGATADYSTDVLATYADSFIRSTDPDQPFFLYFTPYGPHEGATAAPRHSTSFPNLTPYRPPSFNEPNVSDKPAYIRQIPSFSSGQISREDLIRRKQYQTLLSVDDAVAKLVQALAQTGRLGTTLIVFMSDNGFLWGEHRWGATGAQNKQVPYEESIRLPYVVRYDPLTAVPRTDPNLVLNIDLAPTFADLAEVQAPGVEGRSLMSLLGNPMAPWRSDFLVEHLVTNVPSYCAVRSATAIYVRYQTGEEELYLLQQDPYELVNRATDPTQSALVASMRLRARELCSPPPPGYTFP
jgi:N-acetylglucosamine-6-sulfatase